MKNANYFLNALYNNDEKIILEIYENNFRKVLKFVINNSGIQKDAEDVFQKALIQIITRVKVKQFEIKSSFDAYLFVACKNLWRRELNRRKKMVTYQVSFEPINEFKDTALSILEQERWEFFQEKLELISKNCKEILKYYFNKTPYKSIAEKLGYNNDLVVRQRVFKCKKKLIEMIKNDVRYNQLVEL